jgi:hypothetical protein
VYAESAHALVSKLKSGTQRHYALFSFFAAAGHGTHVFGIMAAGHGPYEKQKDRSGIAGVVGPAPQGVAACNAFGSYSSARDGDVIQCIMHAVASNTHWVINLSSSSIRARNNTGHQLYLDAIGELCAAGGIAVLSAGNGESGGSWHHAFV